MAHEQDTVAYAQAKQGGTNCKGLVTSLFPIRSWNGLFYPEKHSFLVLPLHKTRTFDYFFLLSLIRTVTLLFWLLRDFTEKLVKIRPPPPLLPQQSGDAIRYINDQVSRATSNKVVPRDFSSHFKGEALGTRLNLKIANNGFFFRHLL